MKEIGFRPNTGDGDVVVKVKKIQEFLAAGEDVQVVVKFRGREKAHLDIGAAMLKRVAQAVGGSTSEIRASGNSSMSMIVKSK